MNAEKYIQIIDSFVKPFIAKHKEPTRVVCLQDNASYHKKEEVIRKLKQLRVKILDYPYSPDLNPIELVVCKDKAEDCA